MTRPLLNRRLADMGTTIFAEMSALALATGSVNLGQGFPDTDGPREVAQAAADAIMAGRGNQYPPGPGIPELRLAVAGHQKRFYGTALDPDTEVLVTAGATEAIAAAMLALLEPGDEVIAFEPYYDSYAANIAMAGATRVPVTLRPPGFRPDLDAMRAAVTSSTRLLLLNSPHNPTGMVLTRAELAAIAELAVERDLLVVTDEVYEHIVFEGEHVPIATLPGMRERTVSISSAGKTFSFTGWKIGWVTGPANLVSAVRTAKQFLTYVSGGPFQYAIATALGLPDAFYAGLAADLHRKRDLLATGLRSAGLEVFVPQGTYFITTDISPLGERDGVQFCRALPERCGVVAIPNAVFYDDAAAGRSQVRFAFCKKKEVLADASARLQRLGAARRRMTRPAKDRRSTGGQVTRTQEAGTSAAPSSGALRYRAGRQDKPWGHEVIFAAVDGKYAGKIIYVTAGHALSLQYHREKEETISVLSGEALIEYGPAASELAAERFSPGDTIHLPPGALHRITAVTDLTFAEASTAGPGWREDIVRLEDKYGRSGTTAP